MLPTLLVAIASGIIIAKVDFKSKNRGLTWARLCSSGRRKILLLQSVWATMKYVGIPIVFLRLIHRMDTLRRFPLEFGELSQVVREHYRYPHAERGFLVGYLVFLAVITVPRLLPSNGERVRLLALHTPTVLVPRSVREIKWALLASIVAGLGEEMYFRLMLPLLLTMNQVPALASFVLAAILFALAHRPVTLRGSAYYFFGGAAYTALYLASRSLIVPIVAHILVDMLMMCFMPFVDHIILKREIRRGSSLRSLLYVR